MSKSVYYTVWVSDDSRSDGLNYFVCSRPELVSFLRSGTVFVRIEPFNIRSIHEHFITSEPDEPSDFNLDNLNK